MEFLPLRFGLLPERGEFGGVAVQGLGAPGCKAFLPPARMSFGEFGRHVVGPGRLLAGRRLPRSQRNRLWRPRAAAGRLVPFRFAAARLAGALEGGPCAGFAARLARQAPGTERRAFAARRRLFAGRAAKMIEIVGD